MRQTHEGHGINFYKDYRLEVLLQGHVYTLNIEKGNECIHTVWCPDMSVVRKNIRRFLGTEYKLYKIKDAI